MTSDDQQAVIAALSSPSTYDGKPVERIETHAALVFLAGTRAYKLKRAVRFDYLDFSTADRRRASCEAEVRLNRRTASELYAGVIPVTREPDGSFALGGNGESVDWVVEMHRFDQDALFDRLAAAGQLDVDRMPALADAIARFHESAERRPDHGGQAGMRWVVDGNAEGFVEFGSDCFDPAARDRLIHATRAEVDRQANLLDARRYAGFVRHCHGDLHLRNIVMLNGRPTPFDGVEFNDEIACTDVLYDLAFLLMDLWRRRLPRHANAVWNRYLAETGDIEGARLLPLFLSCRAAVRAKTSATAARLQDDVRARGALQALAREYLALAEDFLHPVAPRLIAVGGLSGSGKSTLAMGLAPSIGPAPGAVVLRSDEIRKRLCGVPLLDRLGPDGYARQVTGRVYATLAAQAKALVQGGQSVIADAVYSRPTDRRVIERSAAEASVPFTGLWLEATEATLVQRAEQRRNDASDANADVVRMQHRQLSGSITWTRLDASTSPDAVRKSAESLLQATTGATAATDAD